MKLALVKHGLHDCRAAHRRVYAVERLDGDEWRPFHQLVVTSEGATLGGELIDAIDYKGASHALVLRGRQSDASFSARLDITDCGHGFVGSMSVGTEDPVSIRGAAIESVYHTQRRPAEQSDGPWTDWEQFVIRSEWHDGELKVSYLLGKDDVSDRVRVTSVDRRKGETTLEMPPDDLNPPFPQNQFLIVLASGTHSFVGDYTDDDLNPFSWRGSLSPVQSQERAPLFAATAVPRRVIRSALAATPDPTRLQELDNISSIEIVTGSDGKQMTVDYAQTTCGNYFSRCLVNGLDQKWIDGIFGHKFSVPENVEKVFEEKKAFFQNNSALSTGQMFYDTLATNEHYKDLIKRIKPEALKTAWQDMGKTPKEGPSYQDVSSALYIEGYRDGVAAMAPFLKDNPEGWAQSYFEWLTAPERIQTWQIQVASKMFDNVRQRMYEWYVKLQVLAPKKDYAERFLSISYAALIGVNYAKAQWSEDLKPFLEEALRNAANGTADPSIMDEAQRKAAKDMQELLLTLIQNEDTLKRPATGIANGLTLWTNKNGKEKLQKLADDPELQQLIGNELDEKQYKAWSELTGKGKAGGILKTAFYGASAAFVIYTIVNDANKPATPRQIVADIGLGMLAMALLVKGAQKMLSLGVGRFLENWSKAGEGGAFRTFAGDIATWFKEGGKIVPEGKMGKAFVAIFGESSAEFMARRIGPAMAVVGVVLSAFMLADAIRNGIVRDIVFEALNVFFALADLVFIGLELFSVAWAGPVGLAVAAVGLIIVLVQLIWNWIDPPPPPPDPITDFVNGPLVQKGFATPA